MIEAIVQTLGLAAACSLLYIFWVKTSSATIVVRLLVSVGFLIRALAGQVLFWISYLELPIASDLQMGEGFWFFALDGRSYMSLAGKTASEGLFAILEISKTEPSVAFVQALALFVGLFGGVASVALLLNLFCFLGICALIIRWGSADGQVHWSSIAGVAAVALSPSAILWSLQPLKESFFVLLVVAFAGSCAAWQRIWFSPGRGAALVRPALVAAAILAFSLYGIAGIRWYAAAAALAASAGFLVLVAVAASGRRVGASIASIVLFVLLSRAFLWGGGPYVPPDFEKVLSPSTVFSGLGSIPRSVISSIQEARQGFVRSGGATAIGAGEAIESAEGKQIPQRASSSSGVDVPTKVSDPAAGRVSRQTLALKPPIVVSNRGGNRRPWRHETIHSDGKRLDSVATSNIAQQTTVPEPGTASSGTEHKVSGEQALALAAKPPAGQSAAGAELTVGRGVGVGTSSSPETVGVRMPGSVAGRLTTGLAAFVLPRTLAQSLGIIEVGGGRGLWLFVELDTLFFDIVLITVGIFLFRKPATASLRNPVFWLIFLLIVLVGGPLLYTVTNFGTLFRQRLLIYVTLALLPIALSTPTIDRAQRSPVERSE